MTAAAPSSPPSLLPPTPPDCPQTTGTRGGRKEGRGGAPAITLFLPSALMIPRPPDANERMEKTADLNSCCFFYFYRVAPVQQMNRRKEEERRGFFDRVWQNESIERGFSFPPPPFRGNAQCSSQYGSFFFFVEVLPLLVASDKSRCKSDDRFFPPRPFSILIVVSQAPDEQL